MNKSQKQGVGVAAGLAGLAAAAAGVYFFAGKTGAKNRKKISSWVGKAKNDVMKELKSMQKVTKDGYNQTVDAVAKQYKNLKDIDQSELLALTKELKGHWDSISKELNKAGTSVKRQVKSVIKTPAPRKKPAAKKSPTQKK